MDSNGEPRPSTSSQAQLEKSREEPNLITEDEQGDARASAETSASDTQSERSRLEVGRARAQAPTGRPKKRKNSRPAAGRVQKQPRRQAATPARQRRRSKRIKDNKKKRGLSISTMSTRTSMSWNMSLVRGCPHCGHRCCRRRYDEMKARMLRYRNFCKKKMLSKKCMGTQTSGSECIQAGSACMMLSPLCINTNATLPEPVPEKLGASEITPQMIHEALRRLTMWQQDVTTCDILDDIKRNYPVGLDESLLEELAEKLRVAAIVGIVTQVGPELWRPCCALQQRHLSQNHVTLFWKAFGDTMKPVTKNKKIKKADSKETGQDKESKPVCSYSCLYSLSYCSEYTNREAVRYFNFPLHLPTSSTRYK